MNKRWTPKPRDQKEKGKSESARACARKKEMVCVYPWAAAAAATQLPCFLGLNSHLVRVFPCACVRFLPALERGLEANE